MAFDLNALLAEQEAASEPKPPFTFTFDDYEYSLPPVRDYRAVVAIASGNVYEGLAIMLGADQWGRLKASPTTLTEPALRILLGKYSAHIDGTDMGESSASSGSSKSTAGPSKRTSKGSTRGGRSRS